MMTISNDLPYHSFSGTQTTCMKCLTQDHATIEYQPPGTAWLGQDATLNNTGGAEWLRRTCLNCGYQWPERCADNPGPIADAP